MHCGNCGVALTEGANFCPGCGTARTVEQDPQQSAPSNWDPSSGYGAVPQSLLPPPPPASAPNPAWPPSPPEYGSGFPPPPAPVAQPSTAVFPTASAGERVLGYLIDVLIGFFAVVALNLVLPVFGFFFVILLEIVYEVGMVCAYGATLGKMAVKTRVVDKDTLRIPEAGPGFVRWLVNSGVIFGCILRPLWLIFLIADKDTRTPADKAANTIVVKVPQGFSYTTKAA